MANCRRIEPYSARTQLLANQRALRLGARLGRETASKSGNERQTSDASGAPFQQASPGSHTTSSCVPSPPDRRLMAVRSAHRKAALPAAPA